MVSPRERDLGRYELLLELARGGMAELFLGRLHGAGGFAKLVAIERILPHLAQDKQFTQMFLDEGRIAARLSHPNVCQVFELGDLDGQLFLAMEYLDGVSLAELIAAGRPDPRVLGGVLAQAAEGLHYAHSLRDHHGSATPVVHRDVSPQNLFITVDGICKLLDFGVSKVTTDPSRTKSGVIKGKLPYMSPEQIRGDKVDGRADVFALGVCTWEALAGELLFDRPSNYLTWLAITSEPVPLLSSKWAACSPQVEAVVMRALARTPAERHPSAQVFADELRGALGFASSTEIAHAVRTTCAAALAERAQRVAAALAGRPLEVPSVVTGPVTDAAATIDLRKQPAASMELREHSALVERPTVRSRPAEASTVDLPAKSRVGVIVGIAVTVAVLAVVIIALALRRDPVVVAADASVPREDPFTRLDDGFKRLDEGFEKLKGLERLNGVAKRLEGDDVDEGRLKLTGEAATIYDGDTQLGTMPLDVELPAGKYTLRAVLSDGSERTKEIEIVAGKTTRSKLATW